MIIKLIAYTTLTGVPDSPVPEWKWQSTEASPEDPYGYNQSDIDELAEFAGRVCYQSWDKPNPATATNVGYLANILGKQHFSVLEHASATFYVAEVSRSLSHELVRHRHLSFSQLSQRYVDESEVVDPVIPPALKDGSEDADELRYELGQRYDEAKATYVQIVESMIARSYTRKQARQAARSVLPNATETKFVVTGNMRAWREVIAKRISPAADAEIRQLATAMLRQLREIAPNTFQDM